MRVTLHGRCLARPPTYTFVHCRPKSNRVDFLYEVQQTSAQEYLLGKPVELKPEDSDVKKARAARSSNQPPLASPRRQPPFASPPRELGVDCAGGAPSREQFHRWPEQPVQRSQRGVQQDDQRPAGAQPHAARAPSIASACKRARPTQAEPPASPTPKGLARSQLIVLYCVEPRHR